MLKKLSGAVLVASTMLIVGCAHPITITPTSTIERPDKPLVKKNVAYVMTDADREKQVTTEGGGGDKVSYYPYKDLEKAIRDVSVVQSQNNVDVLKTRNVSYVFVPEITTTSDSPSYFTWPPTKFRVEMNANVTDANGNFITRIRVVGTGNAEFSEFKGNFGLAGSRAADDLSSKLVDEIKNNPKLK
jgi:hypothetical protein